MKKLERNFDKIRLIKETETETIYEAFILDIDNLCLTIYCKDVKYCGKVYIIDKKFENLITINNISNGIQIMNKNNEDKYLTIQKYQKIKIKMIGIINKVYLNQKLIIKIIDPDIHKLLQN